MELRGRVAIVTGGASGAGWTIGMRLAGEGAAVVVADVSDVAGEAAVAAITERGGMGSFVRTDVRVDGDVEHMVTFAEERHGGVDILVNNAGGWGPTANYPHASPLQWSSTLDLNLRAPMLATQLVLEPMRRAGGGAVVNVASTAGLGLGPYVSPEYGAAKAGLIRFTATLAGLRERMGVRVNCVVPDWILTERAEAELAAMTPAERAAAPEPLPLEAVAEAVVGLVTDEGLAGRVVVLRGRAEPVLLAAEE